MTLLLHRSTSAVNTKVETNFGVVTLISNVEHKVKWVNFRLPLTVKESGEKNSKNIAYS